MAATTSIKIDKALWGRIKKVADAGGYSSPEEFVQHAVETAMAKDDPGQGEKGAEKLKGIGYLDAGLDI